MPPHTIDAVILTHMHIDHSGYLPLLAREGFKGPVYCTHATRDLLEILLPDSEHLQEEEARFANRHAYYCSATVKSKLSKKGVTQDA